MQFIGHRLTRSLVPALLLAAPVAARAQDAADKIHPRTRHSMAAEAGRLAALAQGQLGDLGQLGQLAQLGQMGQWDKWDNPTTRTTRLAGRTARTRDASAAWRSSAISI